MERAHILGIAVLILAIVAEILAVWLLPRWGVADPTAGLLAAGLGGALIGALLVWTLGRRRA